MDQHTVDELCGFVSAGADYADNSLEADEGWAWRVGINGPLDMSDPKGCACGQIFGHYERFRFGDQNRDRLSDEELQNFGWYVFSEDSERDLKYQILAQAWNEEAHVRRMRDIDNDTVPKQYEHLIEVAQQMQIAA